MHLPTLLVILKHEQFGKDKDPKEDLRICATRHNGSFDLESPIHKIHLQSLHLAILGQNPLQHK